MSVWALLPPEPVATPGRTRHPRGWGGSPGTHKGHGAPVPAQTPQHSPHQLLPRGLEEMSRTPQSGSCAVWGRRLQTQPHPGRGSQPCCTPRARCAVLGAPDGHWQPCAPSPAQAELGCLRRLGMAWTDPFCSRWLPQVQLRVEAGSDCPICGE